MINLNTNESSQQINPLKPTKMAYIQQVVKPNTDEELILNMESNPNDSPTNLKKGSPSLKEISIEKEDKGNQEPLEEKAEPIEKEDIERLNERGIHRMQIIKDFEANRFSRKILSHLSEIHQADEHYDSLHIPPNWSIAANHAKARSVGTPTKSDEINICLCCGYEIKRKPLKLCQSSYHLKYLGAGYPILFNFYKFCIYLLCLSLLFDGIYNINLNKDGHFCSANIFDHANEAIHENEKNETTNEGSNSSERLRLIQSVPIDERPAIIASKNSPALECQNTWVNHVCLGNVIDSAPDPDTKLDILRSFYFVIMLVSFIVFRRFQERTDAVIDEELNTPADYTVMVSNIPKDAKLNYEEELTNIFSDNVQILGKKFFVKKINLIYECEEVEKEEHRLKKIIEKKKEVLAKNGFNLEDDEVHKLNKMYENKELALKKMKFKMIEQRHNFAGKAFVSFSNEDEKEAILKIQKVSVFERLKAYFKGRSEKRRMNKRLYYDKNLLYIEKAPEPNEVNWESFHCSTKHKLKWRLIINSLFLVLLVACFIIIYVISYFKSLALDKAVEDLTEGLPGADQNFMTISGLSILISLLITVFNKFCLPKLVHMMVDKEMYSTITKLQLSFAIKLALVAISLLLNFIIPQGCFFNTALITLGVEIITFENYFGIGGMIESEHWIFIFNAFFAPLVWLIDPWTIQKSCKRRRVLKKVEETGNKVNLTQEDANKLMEDVDYNMAKRYADVIKTMWFTFFYSTAIPVGTAWSLVGLFLYYWIDKYNLFKRRTIKEGISIELSMAMVDMLEMSFICYGVGSMIVEKEFFGRMAPISIVFMSYGILKLIFPFQRIIKYYFPIKGQNEAISYATAHLNFETDYDRENPVTKHNAIVMFFQEKTSKLCKMKLFYEILLFLLAIASIPEGKIEREEKKSENDAENNDIYRSNSSGKN